MKHYLTLSAATLGLLCAACQTTAPRLNAPPHGPPPEVTADMRTLYDHMTDNALLDDMSVSDVHFLPERAQLNSLGEDRLTRLAALIEMYGGTLRYNAACEDEMVVAARTDTIVAFLKGHGVDATADTVTPGLPGGRGMRADEAILIRANEGTYKPKKSGGSSPNSMQLTFK